MILPRALMIGVGYDLFWTLNPKSLTPFYKAFSLRQKYDDGVAWQIGSYVRMAIGSAFSKDAKYPEQPLSEIKVQSTNKEPSVNMMKEVMLARMVAINSRFGEGVN